MSIYKWHIMSIYTWHIMSIYCKQLLGCILRAEITDTSFIYLIKWFVKKLYIQKYEVTMICKAKEKLKMLQIYNQLNQTIIKTRKKSNQRLQTLTRTSFEWCIYIKVLGQLQYGCQLCDLWYDILCVNLLFLMDRRSHL